MTAQRRPKWGRGYAMTPGWLVRKMPTPNAAWVYVHLAMHGTFHPGEGTYEHCRPSKKTLSKGDPDRGYPGCGLSEQVIGRALRELETLGAIKGEPWFDPKTGAQGATVYRLIFGEIIEEEDEAAGEETAGQEGVSPATPPPHVTSDTGGDITGGTGAGYQTDTPPGVSPAIHNQEPKTKNPRPRKDQTPDPPGLSASHAAREAAPQPGGTEPQPPTPNPGPPETAPAAPSAPEPAPAGGADAAGDDPRRTEAFAALAAELAAAGGWDVTTTERSMLDLLGAGRPVAEITQVLRAGAAGEYGPMGSPRRFVHWWPLTMQAPEPDWARGPMTYLAPGRERCRKHPSEPSGACGRCRADARAVEQDPGLAEPHPAAQQGLTGAALARAVARDPLARSRRPELAVAS